MPTQASDFKNFKSVLLYFLQHILNLLMYNFGIFHSLFATRSGEKSLQELFGASKV